jgi:PAS domain S-box-containing protein
MSEPVSPPLSNPVAPPSPASAGLLDVQELADTIPLPLWIGDARARTVFLNQSWREFSGRPLEQDLGDGWLELVHPADRSRVLDHLEALQTSRIPLKCDYRVRRADGQYRLLHEHSQARLDAQGRPTGFTGTRADITDMHEAEKRLTLETLRQSALINFGRRTLDDPPLAELAQEATRTLVDSLALPCALLFLRPAEDAPIALMGSTGLPADAG